MKNNHNENFAKTLIKRKKRSQLMDEYKVIKNYPAEGLMWLPAIAIAGLLFIMFFSSPTPDRVFFL